MKIYNEIAIDMNPKSSSYGETLHEDSFEYNGDMMLMQAPTVGDTMSTSEDKIFKGYYKAPIHGNPGKLYKTYSDASRAGLGPADIRQLEKKFDYPVYTLNASGGWDKTGSSNEPAGTHYEKLSMAPKGAVPGMENVADPGSIVSNIISDEDTTYNKEQDTNNDGVIDVLDIISGLNEGTFNEQNVGTTFDFTYETDDAGVEEFAPTSEEFRTYTETTGGYGAIAEGFGFEEGDFEEFYGKPLEFWKEEYGTGGTLEQGRGLDLATVAETQRAGGVTLDIAGARSKENLRAAKTDYGFGMKAAGLQTGRNLFDIRQQSEQQMAKSGFATQGTVAGVSRRAQKGVMADYNLQQEQLAEGLAGAKTAFGFSQQEIASGRKGVAEAARIGEQRYGALAETQADIDYRRKQAEFWKTTEDALYEDLTYLDLHKDA